MKKTDIIYRMKTQRYNYRKVIGILFVMLLLSSNLSLAAGGTSTKGIFQSTSIKVFCFFAPYIETSNPCDSRTPLAGNVVQVSTQSQSQISNFYVAPTSTQQIGNSAQVSQGESTKITYITQSPIIKYVTQVVVGPQGPKGDTGLQGPAGQSGTLQSYNTIAPGASIGWTGGNYTVNDPLTVTGVSASYINASTANINTLNVTNLNVPNTLSSLINTMTSNIGGSTSSTSIINSNSLFSSLNTITSSVNGVSTSTSIINTSEATSTGNFLSTIINGATSTLASIINSNIFSITPGELISSVNGVMATSSVDGLYSFSASSTNNNLYIATSTGGIVEYLFTDSPKFDLVTATSLVLVDIATSTTGSVLLGYEPSGQVSKIDVASVLASSTTNIISLSTNTNAIEVSSNVNGVISTSSASIINSSEATSTGNILTTIINGIVSTTANIINSLSTSISGNTLTVDVNGITATSSVISSNTVSSSGNIITSDVNGVISTTTAVNSASLTASGTELTMDVNGINSTLDITNAIASSTTNVVATTTNTFQTIVNGIASAIVDIIETFTQSVAGNTLTTTINGLTATTSVISSNTVSSSGNVITSDVNGVLSTTTAVNSNIVSLSTSTNTNVITTDVNGIVSTTSFDIINSNDLSSAANTLTSTVNGVSSSTSIINSSEATSTGNILTTIINGITSTVANIINSFTQSAAGNILTTTINGVTATSSIVTGNSLTSSGNAIISNVNGVISSLNIADAVASSTSNDINAATTSNTVTVTTNVNGKASSTTFDLVNSNSLQFDGASITSSVNGVATTTAINNFTNLSTGNFVFNNATGTNLVLSGATTVTGPTVFTTLPQIPLQTGYTFVGNGSGYGVGLAPGTVGQIYTSTGTSSVPTWQSYDFNAIADARIALQAGQPNGLATLDATGKVPLAQLPATVIGSTFVKPSFSGAGGCTSEATAIQGDICIDTASSTSYVLQANPYSVPGNWVQLLTPGSPVTSVNSQIGNVTLTASNGLTVVGNTDFRLGGSLSANTTINQNTNQLNFAGSGLMGIGTASPSARLHVSGSTRLDLGGDATGDMYYRTAGGNVGALAIGTSNQIIQPVGGIPTWTSTLNIQTINASTTNTKDLTATGITNLATTTISSLICNITWNIFCDGGNTRGANLTLGTNDNFAQVFETNNSERMRITSTGNVGIGNTNPGNKLEITGTSTNTSGLRFTNMLSSGASSLTTNKVLTVNGSGDVVLALVPGSENIVEFSVNANPNTAGTTFSPNQQNDPDVIYASTIDNSNWKWNGTSYVTYTAVNNNWALNGNTVGAVKTIGTKDNFDLPFITNNTERMRITAAGNVGIGTAASSTIRLNISSPTASGVGVNVLTNDSGTILSSQNTSPLGSPQQFTIKHNLAGVEIKNERNSNISFTASTIGIGTTTPVYKLSVAGTSGTANVQFESLKSNTAASIAAGSGIVIADSNGVVNRVATGTLASTLCAGSTSIYCQSGNTFGVNGILGTKDAFAQTFITNNIERARIDSAGNMGIGTTAPITKLQINNGASAVNGVSVRASADWDALTLAHDGSVAYVNAGGADNGLAFRVGNAASGNALTQSYIEGMRILANGNVGIGTTAPTTKLQVNSGTSGDSGLLLQQLRYGANNPNNGSAATTSTTLAIGVDSNGKVFITNGVGSLDSRAVNYQPQERNAGNYFDFKTNGVDALSDGGTYHGVQTFRPYGTNADFSGGPAYQLGFTSGSGTNGNLWLRTSASTSTWNSWERMLDSGSGWTTTGNASTTAGTNFIGTTDSQALVFKVNNIERLRMATDYTFQTPGSVALSFGNGNVVATTSILANFGANNINNYVNGSTFGRSNTVNGAQGTAIGYGNTASNTDATAIGRSNMATGAQSTAIGYSNTANGLRSLSIGYNNVANDTDATAVGRSNTATNTASVFGYGNNGSGIRSVAIGNSNTASSADAVAVGRLNTSSGAQSTVVGYSSTASGDQSFAAGYSSTATNTRALAIGYGNSAKEVDTTALGRSNNSNVLGSQAVGYGNTSSGVYASAFGVSNTAAGENSSSFGRSNNVTAFATNSSAFGYSNTVQGYYSGTYGYGNNVQLDSNNSFLFGESNATQQGSIYSYAFGRSNTLASSTIAGGGSAFAFGIANTVRSSNNSYGSYARGYGNNIGNLNATNTYLGFADGWSNTINGAGGMAIGNSNNVYSTLTSGAALLIGQNNNGYDIYSGAAAIGNGNTIRRLQYAFGQTNNLGTIGDSTIYNNTAVGTSNIIGTQGIATSTSVYYNTVVGTSNTVGNRQPTYYTSVTGGSNAVDGKYSSIAGYGNNINGYYYNNVDGFYNTVNFGTSTSSYYNNILGRSNTISGDNVRQLVTLGSVNTIAPLSSLTDTIVLGRGNVVTSSSTMSDVRIYGRNINVATTSILSDIDLFGAAFTTVGTERNAIEGGWQNNGATSTDSQLNWKFSHISSQSSYVASAPTNNTSNRFGVGLVNPSSKLHASTTENGNYAARFENYGNNTTSHGVLIRGGGNVSTTTGSNLITFVRNDGTTMGSVQQNGVNSVQYLTTSDARRKTNIVESGLGLEALMNVKVYDYNWIGDETSTKTNGFLAQDLYNVYPDAVSKPIDENTSNWAVDYGRLTPLLVKSIQDLNNKIANSTSTANTSDLIAGLRLASLSGTVEIMGDIKIGGHIIASGDTAGRAILVAGQNHITISFAKPYIHTPIVNVTPRDFVGALNYKVSNESANGFDIEINGSYGSDISFNWVALDVDLGDNNTTQLTPTVVPVGITDVTSTSTDPSASSTDVVVPDTEQSNSTSTDAEASTSTDLVI